MPTIITIDIHCPTHWKQEKKETGDNSNACVCLDRSLNRWWSDFAGV